MPFSRSGKVTLTPFVGVACNVVAGARLALFLPVRRLDFRASAADFAALFGFNVALWLGLAALREGRIGDLEPLALMSRLAAIPVVLLTALAIARVYREPQLLLPLAVAFFASDPVFELAGLALAWFEPTDWAGGLYLAFFAWVWVIAVRAVAVCGGTRGPELVGGAAAASAMVAAFLFGFPQSSVWAPEPKEERTPALAAERVFHLQGELIAKALDGIAAGAPGRPELYFVGFAPDGSQDVFLREMRMVRRVVEERFGAQGRSIVLANGDGALEEFPVASLTNLRRALARVGERMNAEEDVLLLYVSAHGDDGFRLSASQAPLELMPLNPTSLARALAGSAVRWKVVIVSACYSGGFVEPLKDANTLIITAAAADRHSFGCEHGRESTYFGNAYFGEGLAQTRSFAEAFRIARERVAQQEAAEQKKPSQPQLWVGAAIGAALAAIER